MVAIICLVVVSVTRSKVAVVLADVGADVDIVIAVVAVPNVVVATVIVAVGRVYRAYSAIC